MHRYVNRNLQSRGDFQLERAPRQRTPSRAGFLKLAGASLAAVPLLGTLPGTAFAQDRDKVNGGGPGSARSALMGEFKEAAREYGVPVGLLIAMGYTNTRLKMPPPRTNEYEEGDLHGWGAYGIMALVKNPFSNTLGEAAGLTGIPEDELKTDRRSNILGGAALLSESVGRQKPGTLAGYRGAVAGKGGRGEDYEAVAGVGAGDLYANQVFGALERGFSAESDSGEEVSLPAQALERGLAPQRMDEISMTSLTSPTSLGRASGGGAL